MQSTRNINRTRTYGHPTGADFDDLVSIPNTNTAVISRIVVTSNTYIESLTVHYSDTVGVRRGGGSATSNEFTITPGQFITKVEGTYLDSAISKIGFWTNKGEQWGPYGNVPQASTFVWEFGPDKGLLGFIGKADNYLRTLGAIFGTYKQHNQARTASVVTYEKQVNTPLDLPGAVVLSKFSRNLMSSTVTLLIGADCVEFHVPQRVLCTLPFFQAALQGEFREASEQKIEMPEDEPQIVSALIEFLYTGGYTYAYSPAEESDADAPPANFEEGSFHVSVYATAFKYDCQELVKAALTSFLGVLGQLTGITVIRLWKAAYDKQLLLFKVRDDAMLAELRDGLVVLLKEVYITHGEEMDTISEEHPGLMNDLLRLVVS